MAEPKPASALSDDVPLFLVLEGVDEEEVCFINGSVESSSEAEEGEEDSPISISGCWVRLHMMMSGTAVVFGRTFP